MPDGGIHEDFLHVAGLVQIGSLNWTMRPHILVGIENTERRRDLTGPTNNENDREIAPEVGGSAAYRAFLKNELMPFIEGQYRTTDERSIVGESLAGLFVVETLLTDPALFDGYLAIDPSLWWDDERLVENAATILQLHPDLDATLFVAVSGQPGLNEVGKKFIGVLEEADPRGLEIHFRDLSDEEHHTVYHPAALQGFRALFPRPQE
jgi:predicted alpha/beta superfamily hydrolase